MNEKSHEDGSSGRLVRVATQAISPAPVDCSVWDYEVQSEQWSTGRFIKVDKTVNPTDVNQGSFISAESLSLEITLRLDPGIDSARAYTLAVGLVSDLLNYDPTLGLTYDANRSRAENNRVSLVLIPKRPGPDTIVRLERIVGVIQKFTGKEPGYDLNGVRVLSAA